MYGVLVNRPNAKFVALTIKLQKAVINASVWQSEQYTFGIRVLHGSEL